MQCFELYLTASGINKWTRRSKWQHCHTWPVKKPWKSTTCSRGMIKSHQLSWQNWKHTVTLQIIVTWERHLFNSRNQQPGEMIDQYVSDLKTKAIAKSCEFGTLSDSLIRDRIIGSIVNGNTQSRCLLRQADLTFQTAIDMCQASKLTAAHMKILTESHAWSKPTIRNSGLQCI